MALGENALLDWTKLKTYFPDLADAQQAYFELLIEAASSTANRYAKRKLKARDLEVVSDGPGSSLLLLPEYPINSITSVFVDRLHVFGADTEITDYLRYDEEGILYLDREFPSGAQCIKVNYNGGYQTVPPDLEFAVVETTWWNRGRLQLGNIGTKSLRDPTGIGTDYELTVPVNAQRVFEEYRRNPA